MRPERLAEVLAPRDGVIAERAVGGAVAGPDGGGGRSEVYRFEEAEGPLAWYAREVRVEPAGGGLVTVTQDVRFRVGIPFVSWLFALPMRANLGGLGPGRRCPWWAPPGRLDQRAARTLATLCALSVLVGYLGSVLVTTMTYAGRQFGVGNAGQGVALAVVQVNAVLALALLARADKRGRRTLILRATMVGALFTALGALSPSLPVLTGLELVGGALLAAQEVLLGVMAVEEMPQGSRAWALGLISMSNGLGGGFTLLVLPLADLGPGGWRWVYVFGLLAIPLTAGCARYLPESARWQREQATTLPAGPGGSESAEVAGSGRRRWTPELRRRLLIVGAGALLFALFDAPSGQLQNQYLRTERHWSATRISLAEQVAGTIGGLGTLAGGRLADTHGRKPVAIATVGLGALATLVMYFTRGASLYGAMTLSNFFGYAVVPALAVYGAELFPTRLRGRAGGILTVLAAAGGVIGLGGAGLLAGAFGTIGPALAVTAIGPLALVVLIALAYPETANRKLEDLNPVTVTVPAVSRVPRG